MPEEAGNFFSLFPFTGISYWYTRVGGEQRLPCPGRHGTAGGLALLGL